MKLIVILLILFIFNVTKLASLSLSDFTPNFLNKTPESSGNNTIQNKPLINVKRNASQTSSWYCNRIKDAATNVFCNKNMASSPVINVTVESNNFSDKTVVIDNSVSGNYNQLITSPLLQDQKTIDYIQKQPNFFLPLQPSKDININVNQQQIEINIKY